MLAGFKDLPKYPAFEKAVALERGVEAPALAMLRKNVPSDYNGTDVAKPMLLGSIVFLALILRGFALKFDSDVNRLRRKRDYYARQDSHLMSPALLSPDKLDRAKLLEVYAEVKKSLDGHKKNLAFLSIDIVDSTGMKAGEDPGIAENDFRQYKRLVEDILEPTGR